ncbi:MaoC family dehydratase [Streptomyces odontomachi]|uniref:MaoC family dehydratase n=1 Tax=Streptomyces odontomachi TaxID=2944940 RepID=UPI00210D1196|nr:MaoC/PaaZ C-terminal domain-containing protein [Streptomyces sp. ODS25]
MSSSTLVPHLLRGAALSPFKRPRADASLPDRRVVVPGLRVDRRRLAAYAAVCGFDAPDAAGAALPVTYPHVLGFPSTMRLMSGWDFPLPVLGLVHTAIEIRQLRELRTDAEYELTVHAAELTPHRRGTEARIVTRVRTAGETVWESDSSYLARHATRSPGSPDAAADTGGGTDGAARALPVRAEWRLGGDLGRRYGAASGDRNPIHLYPLTARLFGFPRAIVHGMWSVGRCLAEYGVQGPVEVTAAFRKPVLLPGTVHYAAEGPAFALRGGPDGERVHLTGEVRPLAE